MGHAQKRELQTGWKALESLKQHGKDGEHNRERVLYMSAKDSRKT